jgi:hypothetical protein
VHVFYIKNRNISQLSITLIKYYYEFVDCFVLTIWILHIPLVVALILSSMLPHKKFLGGAIHDCTHHFAYRCDRLFLCFLVYCVLEAIPKKKVKKLLNL